MPHSEAITKMIFFVGPSRPPAIHWGDIQGRRRRRRKPAWGIERDLRQTEREGKGERYSILFCGHTVVIMAVIYRIGPVCRETIRGGARRVRGALVASFIVSMGMAGKSSPLGPKKFPPPPSISQAHTHTFSGKVVAVQQQHAVCVF